MLNKLKFLYKEYPPQYWLMITGVVISTAGGSMIWPFLLIYASGKLNMPLSAVATLISINAGTGLLSSFVAGTLADKIGRKVVMNFSLTVNGFAYFLLMRAETYPQFVGLMIMIGLSNPLYQVGADAMLADMIPFSGQYANMGNTRKLHSQSPAASAIHKFRYAALRGFHDSPSQFATQAIALCLVFSVGGWQSA